MRSSVLALLLLVPAGAARADCVALKPQIVGGVQGYVDADGGCLVDIGPSDSNGMVYRSYAFSESGSLIVFDSYGIGANSATTGAREFYFFPRTTAPKLVMDAETGTITVTMANGDEVAIDSTTAQLRSSSRGEIAVAARVDPADLGGVEFPHYDGLILDTGYARGSSSAGSPDRPSTFRSPQGQLCRVANREIFSYEGGDYRFKFDDAALSAFLKKRCPALHAGF